MGLFTNINREFVSDEDHFIDDFNKTHALSPSQIQEIAKHKKIATLRDHKQDGVGDEKLWDEF